MRSSSSTRSLLIVSPAVAPRTVPVAISPCLTLRRSRRYPGRVYHHPTGPEGFLEARRRPPAPSPHQHGLEVHGAVGIKGPHRPYIPVSPRPLGCAGSPCQAGEGGQPLPAPDSFGGSM